MFLRILKLKNQDFYVIIYCLHFTKLKGPRTIGYAGYTLSVDSHSECI